MLTHLLMSGLATVAEPASEAVMPYETIAKLGFVLAVIGIVGIVSALKTMARERTRREIAAYVAEGSMTPEQAEKLITSRFKDS
jgi:hypothetical protein